MISEWTFDRSVARLGIARSAAVGAIVVSTAVPAGTFRGGRVVPCAGKLCVAVVVAAAVAACTSSPEPSPTPATSVLPPLSSSVPVSSGVPTTPAPAPASTLSTGPPAASSVRVVPAPTGPITAVQLGSPEAAAVTWLSRWCSFDWHTPLGTRENQAHPAMTERAWLNFDPLTAPPVAQEWAVIVAARESAVCSAPVALISPEAPRSPTGAYVIVTAYRVLTPQGRAPVVELVRETRQVLFREGRWLVDIAANGAG